MTSAESTTESPAPKRRRTTTHRYIEQDLQEAIEMDVKRKGNRTKTWPTSQPWPCDGPWPSQQLSQDTPATLAPLSPGTAASLTMASQHVKVPSRSATAQPTNVASGGCISTGFYSCVLQSGRAVQPLGARCGAGP